MGMILAENLQQITLEKCAQEGLDNARENLPFSKQSILELKDRIEPGKRDSAVVIAAGPSLHRNDVARKLKDSNFSGTLIATESAMSYCLRNGLVPDIIITLDPHHKRIVRFFGDPDLTMADLEADDYFRRQDLDPEFRENEIKRNKDLLDLVNKHGSRIKAVVATCASRSVVRRCVESGMPLFWWNPFYDDYDIPGSVTKQVHELNQLPCLNAGGNVGTACWVIAHSILQIEEVALVGMDLSYYADTDYLQTQYYYELLELVGKEQIEDVFIHIENPFLKRTWYTDPTYYWYREVFLEMAEEAPCRTYNCTEGGILFGEGIDFIPLQEFLASH